MSPLDSSHEHSASFSVKTHVSLTTESIHDVDSTLEIQISIRNKPFAAS